MLSRSRSACRSGHSLDRKAAAARAAIAAGANAGAHYPLGRELFLRPGNKLEAIAHLEHAVRRFPDAHRSMEKALTTAGRDTP